MSGRVQHFVSISGGKDSAAAACKAKERSERREMAVRYLFADTGNENQITLDHVGYIGKTLGIEIETVRADFAARFEARRVAIRRDWVKELRRKQHSRACLAACKDLSYAFRAMVREDCDCPIKVSPALPLAMAQRAVELMQPSGNPFLDMAMLRGRFPGSQTRFCTEELKLEPMAMVRDAVRLAGMATVEWIGTRADESDARAAMPVIERISCAFRAPTILYRPIHYLSAADVFDIARRHGLKPNPLYLMGFGRVGCFPCIMCTKEELRLIAMLAPHEIDRLEEWEMIVGAVARHAYTALMLGERDELVSSFMPTDKVPVDANGNIRATIRRAVEWSKTSRGGRNYDLLAHLDELHTTTEPTRCRSQYGLCE